MPPAPARKGKTHRLRATVEEDADPGVPVGLPVGEVTRVADGHILVQLYAQLDRMEYIRLVDYSLPGILMQDLGIDTSQATDVTSPAGKLHRAQ